MKITAITKLKSGLLWSALKRTGWSQTELARRCGTAASNVAWATKLSRSEKS